MLIAVSILVTSWSWSSDYDSVSFTRDSRLGLNDVKSDYGTQFTGAISRELVSPYSFGSAELRMSSSYVLSLYLRLFECIGIDYHKTLAAY